MSDKRTDTTRQRLISVAGEIFAERGFEAATIREISRGAAANVAAIHYHFRDKQGLYRATIEAAQESFAAWDPIAISDGQTPVEMLRLFLYRLLTPIPDPKRPGWHLSLLRREMLDPTPECRPLVEAWIRPVTTALQEILHELLPSGLTAQDRRLVAFSVVGQCLLYRVQRPLAELLVGSDENGAVRAEQLADHISRFCLAALGVVPPLGQPLPSVGSVPESRDRR